MEQDPVVIIGAGPAGLTAAYQLMKRNIRSTMIEKTNQVNGLTRTEIHTNYRFDMDSHRFFTHLDQVQLL